MSVPEMGINNHLLPLPNYTLFVFSSFLLKRIQFPGLGGNDLNEDLEIPRRIPNFAQESKIVLSRS